MRLRTIGVVGMVLCSIAADASSKLDDSPLLRPKKADVGAGVVLAEFDGKTWALVADEDDSAVRIFETKPPHEAAIVKVAGTPSQIVVTKAGKVLVALKDKGTVAILEPKGGDPRTLVQRGSIATGGEPVALGLTGDEATLLVASAWTHEVSAYSMADRSLKWKTNVSREPRAIAIVADGSKAWINHGVSGVLTQIDVSDGTTTTTSLTVRGTNGAPNRVATQGFALAMTDGKIFAPSALANPEAAETYYGASMETFSVTVVDSLAGAVKDDSKTFTLAAYDSLERCILPRAAAVSTDGKALVVGCAGDNEVTIMDATSSAPQQKVLRKRDVGDSPSALAIDDATSSVVSWSQMGRMFSIASIGEKATPLAKVSASGGALSASAGRGRRLFYAVDGKTAHDGRACASCHTEGRDDGLVWQTPEESGRRRCSPDASPTPRRSVGRATRRRSTSTSPERSRACAAKASRRRSSTISRPTSRRSRRRLARTPRTWSRSTARRSLRARGVRPATPAPRRPTVPSTRSTRPAQRFRAGISRRLRCASWAEPARISMTVGTARSVRSSRATTRRWAKRRISRPRRSTRSRPT
jgi:DNA-binding beta-propeller fold protein YncE